MKKIIQNFVGIVLGLALVCLFFFAMLTALEKQSEVNCYKLQSQSREYQGFFLTESEKTTCDALGIKINAVVRGGNGEIIQ